MGPTIACVIGTRPEAVKMSQVVLRLRRLPGLAVRILATGQHRGLLDRALDDFALVADRDLDLMQPDQGLAGLTARALVALTGALEQERPDLVLAQGDTTTVLATGLACYYLKIPFGHVEAGLRTGRPYAPFPEEKNRVLAGHLAALHFAPTLSAHANLLREGIDPATIYVTGNPGIDALLAIAARPTPLPVTPATPQFVLVTAHRRESWGAPLERVCAALRSLLDRHDSLSLVFPVHPNQRVRDVAVRYLGDHPRALLIDPVAYPQFVALMRGAALVLTDSGGVQEEAPALGTPVLVLRDETERPEGIVNGVAKLVGTQGEAVAAAVAELLGRPVGEGRTVGLASPYGDGRAAERIGRIVAARLGLDPGPAPADLWEWPASSIGAGAGIEAKH
jgi:UDP-N-acetylglucosamine 2-epimerase (non-hydrolysing)